MPFNNANPSLDLKAHVPGYTIETVECSNPYWTDEEFPEIDYFYYSCPQLTWDAESFYGWLIEWDSVDYSLNGLFPEIGLYDVVELYFLLFNVDEDTWSQSVGGN